MLAAGGSGRRMGGAEPKQFAALAGVPILVRALWPFVGLAALRRAVVAVPGTHVARARELVAGVGGLEVEVVAGGVTRQESVRRALAEVGPVETVLVHDAARPLASSALAARVLEAVDAGVGVVPVVAVRDTIRRVRGPRIEVVPREELRAAQTPQGFPRRLLEEVHRRASAEGAEATDDAALLERYGHRLRLVEGEPANLKLTEPADLLAAEALLGRAREGGDDGTKVRTGLGLDVHRIEPGRPCVLGGVRIDSPAGPVGYSDADVLTHAVMDALLGAAGEPDIGHRFPDTDPRYAGADSLRLLAGVAAELGSRFEVLHVDAVLVAEAPRIAPFVGRIRERLAGALGVPPARVNVKATTAEGLGALGRREGIAAQAIATLRERR